MAHAVTLSPVHPLDQGSIKEPANPPKAKTMRLSCDNCLAAKVKCAKQRPTCTRCLDLEATCVYSPSRRTGKPAKSSKKLPTPSESDGSSSGLSRTVSPQSVPSSVSMDWDDASWSMDPSGTSSLFQIDSDPMRSNFGSMNSLDFNFQLPPNGSADSRDAFNGNFSNVCSTDLNQSVNWLADMEASSMTDVTAPSTDFTLSTATANNPNGTSSSCTCRNALQATLNTLKTSVLPFDRFIITSKSAVDCMTRCLRCNCPSDMSAFMLLSLTITQVVQWARRIRKGECQASKEIGMTAGSHKFDSRDELQIRQTLLRSELQKIKSLISCFHKRFQNFLQGSERHLFEANLEFLEQGVDTTVADL